MSTPSQPEQREPAAATAPAPTTPPAPALVKPAAPQAKTAGPGRLVLVALSLISLVVAVAGTGIGLYALTEARAARTELAQLTGGNGTPDRQPPAAETPGSVVTTTAAAPRPSATAGVLDPRASYGVKYEKQVLVISDPGCYSRERIDLDEPRVAPGGGVDVTVSGACNSTPATAEIDGKAALSASAQVTPNECVELLRTAPLSAERAIPLNRGVVLCVHTDFSAAQTAGLPWIIALVEVTSVGNDGRVELTVTAWNVPN
jgi:hypothetical protein